MLDFLRVKHKVIKNKYIEVYPEFRVAKSKDLMIRGETFYAVWNDELGLWSTDEYDIPILIDRELYDYADKLREKEEMKVVVRSVADYNSMSWSKFKNFIGKLSDNNKQLDTKITFANSDVVRSDYVSKRLPYSLSEGPTNAFDELFGTLYDKDNLEKIMWSIGSIISGDSKKIQKFMVFFGPPGTGKSTALNLIQSLFVGYYSVFEAQSLVGNSTRFAMEMFSDNPLLAINHEGDLSKIRDNSILNSVVAHDDVVVNVKYKHPYTIRVNTMLFIATNKPVTITDAKSGLIRRLIDVRPTGSIVPPDVYDRLVAQMEFELGAIAHACLEVYNRLGATYYNRYRPIDMMFRTNIFFNFVDEHILDFTVEEHITLSRAWKMYKEFCENSDIKYTLPKYQFRDELKQYFTEFHHQKKIEGIKYSNVFIKFNMDAFRSIDAGSEPTVTETSTEDWLIFKGGGSIFDEAMADCKAQYGGRSEHLPRKWDNVTTTLSDIKTSRIHYVLPRKNLITIDFDIKDNSGKKSFALNAEAASKFPPTYAELSKSGEGIHLHYFYDGDTEDLSRIYDENIEVLVPKGKFSIRRRLTKSNNTPIATINSGLPLKGVKSMVSAETIKSERSLRILIHRNLNKEIHPGTKPSVDFIGKILRDANASGLVYDVSDLQKFVLNFASNSTNHAPWCIGEVLNMPFSSDKEAYDEPQLSYKDDRLVFYDVEVFKNLLLICWKYEGNGSTVTRMFNPSPSEVEGLLSYRLVGFNNRRYDNHILYARVLGYNNEQLYNLSSNIVNGNRSVMFREAYGLSWTDVYDYANTKKSLKAWEVDLGLPFMEFEHPWDEPLPEELWEEAAEYCDNDTVNTEAVHNHLKADYTARLILAELSGLSVNDKTANHAARIIFGPDFRNSQSIMEYTDLSETFPGYTFNMGKSLYRGEDPGEGGYVYSIPGIYRNVLYVDVTSMHPTSAIRMNLFGKRTKFYEQLLNVRVAIKEGLIDKVREMLDGRLKPYLEDPEAINGLEYALKIVLNIVYGMTSAKYPNPFRDDRNKDNIVAKRGSLFMIELKHALMERGSKCVHFKTDSVKIADATEDDVIFVKEFAKKYGYEFKVEAWFEKMALVNKSVLIAKTTEEYGSHWEAVGAQFAHPYVFKTLFSKEKVEYTDLEEVRNVNKGNIYIRYGGDDSKDIRFIGRIGKFYPMKKGGGKLLRVHEGKEHAVANTNDWLWLPVDLVKERDLFDDIDMDYFKQKVDDAIDTIGEFGDPTQFLD